MYKKSTYLFILLCNLYLLISCSSTKQPDLNKTQYVDTRIGTQNWEKQVMVSDAESPSGFVMPLVSAPFASINWTPQTCKIHNAHIKVQVAYWWADQKLQGFRGTRYPNGAVMMDWGCISTMPMTGKLEGDAQKRASNYRHETEIAQPHFYKVNLDTYQIEAQMTAGKHTGYFQYTFPKTDSAHILIDGVYQTERFCVLPKQREIRGISSFGRSGIKSFFVAKFNKEFSDYGLLLDDGKIVDSTWVPEGFHESYFNNVDLKGKPVIKRKSKQINYVWPASPAPEVTPDNFSVRWTGIFVPRATGKHTFFLTSDDGARLFIDGKKIINGWEYRGTTTNVNSIQLKKGQKYKLCYEYFEGGGASTAKLACQDPLSTHRNNLKIEGERDAKAAYASFKTKKGEKIEVKIGTSLISYKQAKRNLEKDFPTWNFKEAVAKEQKRWNQTLSQIEVSGSSKAKKIFYTALNRCHILPRNLNEEGHYFSPFDYKIHTGEMFTDLSIWDTFRAEHPLLVLLQPELSAQIIQGLLNAYDEGGWIPKWPNPGYANVMMGTHGDAVIADAYTKGITAFDTKKALKAMLKNANQKGDRGYAGRVGIEEYNQLGYVPADKYGESVARTLEFAYDDYCIAQMAKTLNKEKLYQEYTHRSQRYKNVYNQEKGMIRGKNKQGKWLPHLDPSISVWAKNKDPKVTEAYYRNHTLLVPHDVKGLAKLMGGNKKLVDFLDYFFAHDFYYVGDEFSMHAPYMYNLIDAPWRTQKTCRDLLDFYFTSSEGGLPGNDDCGQLSAWYVFGAIGLYPVCPGNPIYQIGSPIFNEITIKVGKQKNFTIKTKHNSKENVYIQSATLNGKPYPYSWISHQTLLDGGEILFEMGNTPNKDWGIKKERE